MGDSIYARDIPWEIRIEARDGQTHLGVRWDNPPPFVIKIIPDTALCPHAKVSIMCLVACFYYSTGSLLRARLKTTFQSSFLILKTQHFF